MEDINILGEYENIELTTLLRTFKREGIENFVVVRKNNLENLIKAYKELEEDLTSVYLKGVYDERDKWKIKVKKKIEEIIQNSSHFNMISPLNYDKEYYETRFAVDKLQELLEESEK